MIAVSFSPSASSTSSNTRARRRKGVGQRLAHADGLAALARKHECGRHAIGFLCKTGPKDTDIARPCQANGLGSKTLSNPARLERLRSGRKSL